MKHDHPVITLLGSNSGNNVGDAAILSSVLETLARELPGVETLVPTTKPSFVRKHYAQRYFVRAFSMMPWTGSIRLIGLPTFWALWRSDAALICDGIIFGKKLFNPFFNWLILLFVLAPFARLVGCKLVCYSTGIGPFPSALSARMARSVINQCDLVMMREEESIALCHTIGVTKPVELTGDAAFINLVSPDSRASEILKAENVPEGTPLLGVNVTKYMDTWMAGGTWEGDRSTFLQILATGIQQAQATCGFTPVVFSTHPMDEGVARELAEKLGAKLIKNTSYLSHDMQAVMRRCELFTGMRFHSLILASAVQVPIVGLVYAPKVLGYMKLLRCDELALSMKDLTAQRFGDTLTTAWRDRVALREKQRLVIDGLKQRAHAAGSLLKASCFPDRLAESNLLKCSAPRA